MSMIRMPQLGESVTEGMISCWLKKPGDPVALYEPICEVATDKVNAEVPSPYTGVMARIFAPAGSTIGVGKPICQIVADQAEFQALASQSAGFPTASVSSGGEGSGESVVGGRHSEPVEILEPGERMEARYPTLSSSQVEDLVPPSEIVDRPPTDQQGEEGGESPSAARLRGRVAPVVARLAEQYNVDISEVPGTGRGGRVTRDDVWKWIQKQQKEDGEGGIRDRRVPVSTSGAHALPVWEGEGGAVVDEPALFSQEKMSKEVEPVLSVAMEEGGIPVVSDLVEEGVFTGERTSPAESVSDASAPPSVPSSPSPPSSSVPGRDLPLTPMRKIISQRMVQSWQTAPQAWLMMEADVSGLVALRNQEKDAFQHREGVPLTYLPFFLKAAAEALRECPSVNASFVSEDVGIRSYRNVHIAVAISHGSGLYTPVLRDADTLSLHGLAQATQRLIDRTRQGKLSPEDLQDATFTLNNTGALGSVVSHSILNPPQAAMLACEVIRRVPVVVDHDMIAIRDRMNLSLTIDHRVLDGSGAAAFLHAVKERLEAYSPTQSI
ncbi:dihydrolipoamide acetyltransferase family protein [Pasteuria penetrans]|uniref:dihydrolipoamide acetyltransferase family protein n=1 Tax=Pasteuria penetrans TaxID=86005 RepID=UPI000F993AD3|nr:dihydrolipoamide acetyltransferase family protein [Pasteuria penetrans]